MARDAVWVEGKQIVAQLISRSRQCFCSFRTLSEHLLVNFKVSISFSSSELLGTKVSIVCILEIYDGLEGVVLKLEL